jgi:hypothetical protein
MRQQSQTQFSHNCKRYHASDRDPRALKEIWQYMQTSARSCEMCIVALTSTRWSAHRFVEPVETAIILRFTEMAQIHAMSLHATEMRRDRVSDQRPPVSGGVGRGVPERCCVAQCIRRSFPHRGDEWVTFISTNYRPANGLHACSHLLDICN